MFSYCNVTLRSATPADAAVLRQWNRQPHIIAAKGAEDGGWERRLEKRQEWREPLIAEVDSRPIGYVEIIDPARGESRYWGAVQVGLRAIDIWIGEKSKLGKGYGPQMMRLVLGRCFADQPVSAVLVHPFVGNTLAHRFYERFGFQLVERRCFGEDECYVYRLER